MVNTTKKTVLIVFSVAIVGLVIGLTVGLTLHFTLNDDDEQVPVARQSFVGNCWPQDNNATEATCLARGCVWLLSSDGAPNCTFPDKYGYEVKGSPPVPNDSGFDVSLSRIDTPSLFGNDVTSVRVSVTYETNSRLHIKFTDAEKNRYEVPKEAINITYDASSPPTNETRLYDVTWIETPRFGLRVTRRSTGAVVFDTTTPGFVFSDQYIQMTVALPSENVYGFGEHNHRQFRHNMTWKKWTIFTRDEAPVGEWNLYGAQPMYMNLESDGSANGVFLLNSNAMDVVLQPNPYPAITYHIIGGIPDFYIFLGPTPENVVQQYTEAVGRSLMPPYWALGFQLSRWDYDNLTYAESIVDRNNAAGIPQDVQFGDVDYMESKLMFTYDKVKYNGLPGFVDRLHQKGLKYIILLDHGFGSDKSVIQQKLNGTYLPLSDGEERRIFIFDPRNKSRLLYGEVWPGEAVYPDFTLGDNITSWWVRHCSNFWNNTDINDWDVPFDALWIDMNEPSNFIPGSTTGCDRNNWNYPPYMPNILGGWQGHLYEKTICMDAEQHWGRHYDVHSLYGHSMAITSFRTLRELFPEKRPFVLTRSNFAGTQKYAVHWLGDNQSQWVQMGWSIVGMLEYSLFGFSYTGADICGFWYATTEQMCQRWMQLGAFYPFSRNHNAATWPDQDPTAFSAEMTRVSKEILETRYKLLPFLYTLLHEAHVYGSTVVRPLLHEFPTDQQTLSIDRQFLWGPSFLISPVLDENVLYVNAYFPRGTWYDYYGGERMDSVGTYKNLSTPLDRIQLHVRAGYIIPWQVPANTTVFSRRNPMGLIVALEPTTKQAKGNLFWDDGESFETFQSGKHLHVEFQSSAAMLQFIVRNDGYPEASSLSFQTIDLWGYGQAISGLNVDGVALDDTHIRYDSATKNVQLVNLNMVINGNHTVTWQSVP